LKVSPRAKWYATRMTTHSQALYTCFIVYYYRTVPTCTTDSIRCVLYVCPWFATTTILCSTPSSVVFSWWWSSKRAQTPHNIGIVCIWKWNHFFLWHALYSTLHTPTLPHDILGEIELKCLAFVALEGLRILFALCVVLEELDSWNCRIVKVSVFRFCIMLICMYCILYCIIAWRTYENFL